MEPGEGLGETLVVAGEAAEAGCVRNQTKAGRNGFALVA